MCWPASNTGCFRKSSCEGQGVALVFRAVFHYRKLDFDLNPQTFEFLAVMLTLGVVRTLVVTIYCPDGRNNAFNGEFESLLEMIAVYNCNFIILGDVNIHHRPSIEEILLHCRQFRPQTDGRDRHISGRSYTRHPSRWQWQIGQDIHTGSTPWDFRSLCLCHHDQTTDVQTSTGLFQCDNMAVEEFWSRSFPEGTSDQCAVVV